MVRIGQIGFGGIGQEIATALSGSSGVEYVCVVARERQAPSVRSILGSVRVVSSPSELIDSKPDVVIECAGHQALVEFAPEVLRAGIDVIAASVGILANDAIRENVLGAARAGDATLCVASGAIGGLDIIAAGAAAGAERVTYSARKNPRLWRNTPAEARIDLDRMAEPTRFFEGNARQAAIEFPDNCNVTAALSLAGVGFENTAVELWADHTVEYSEHSIRMKADTGTVEIVISNSSSGPNKRSSYLTAMSIVGMVLSRVKHMRIGN